MGLVACQRSELCRSQRAAYSEGRQRYSQCLLGLVVVGVEPVRRKLLYVSFGEAARLGLAQALGQVQQGLRGEHEGVGGAVRRLRL